MIISSVNWAVLVKKNCKNYDDDLSKPVQARLNEIVKSAVGSVVHRN